MPSSWPETAAELEALQRELAELEPPPWHPPANAVAGAVFAASATGHASDTAWVAAVALDWVVIRGTFAAPYQPGLLALREGRLLERAVRALEPRPDYLIVNATARDHPRRAGLAWHLGWALDLPTIGVTDRLLAHGEGARRAGPGRGVYVHGGWRVGLETALALLEPHFEEQTPAPLREARRLARTGRAELG
ncbi:MAG TPA: endonuclease V [Candidatus Dormibacteraeota bacterium]